MTLVLTDKQLKQSRKAVIKAIKRGESVIYNCEVIGDTIVAYNKLNVFRSIVLGRKIKVVDRDGIIHEWDERYT